MRKLLAEFKAIAIGGNVLDLALGFIIGTAFATLIQSFVTNIFLQLVAAIAGKRDFQALDVKIADTPIKYGVFLNDLLQFVLLAVALFVVVKFITWVGIERGRTFDHRSCPYCFDRIPRAALACRSCGQALVAELPTLEEAERMLAERESRRWPTLPLRPRRRAPGVGPADQGEVDPDRDQTRSTSP